MTTPSASTPHTNTTPSDPGRKVRLPSYRLHRPSGQAVVTLGGHDHYLGPHGSDQSREAYDRLIAEYLSRGRRALRGDNPLTVSELILRYYEHALAYYKPNSLYSLRGTVRRLRRLYGPTPAEQLGPQAFKALRYTMIEEGLSRTTINRFEGWVKTMVRWAVEEELLPASCHHALSAVRQLRAGRSEALERAPVTAVSEQVLAQTLERLPPVVADMVMLQRLTGMRPGELCGLTPGELDTSGEIWMYRPQTHKNAHHGLAREVAIGPRAQLLLASHLHTQPDRAVFRPHVRQRGGGEADGLFRPAQDGYTVAAYRRAITRACDQAGVAHWSPNQLRHARAQEIRRDFGIEAVQAALGHQRVETSQIYAKRTNELSLEVARRCG